MSSVSIVVPVFNLGCFLDECLVSILRQTFEDWECIIVNDGSYDNTDEIARQWLIRDSRFKYVSIQNGGLSNARNVGIRLANSEFILPLDADDAIEPNYLRLIVDAFHGNHNLRVVYGKARKFGAVDEEWKLPDFTMKGLLKNNLIFCSAGFRKSDWKRVGGYDLSFMSGLEDWDFWLSIIEDDYQVLRLDYFVFRYRVRIGSMSENFKDSELLAGIRYHIQRKHLNLYYQHFGFIGSVIKEKEFFEARFYILLRNPVVRVINFLYTKLGFYDM